MSSVPRANDEIRGGFRAVVSCEESDIPGGELPRFDADHFVGRGEQATDAFGKTDGLILVTCLLIGQDPDGNCARHCWVQRPCLARGEKLGFRPHSVNLCSRVSAGSNRAIRRFVGLTKTCGKWDRFANAASLLNA